MTDTRISMIRKRLEAAFQPQALEILDESHRHAGHPGARDGRGHFDMLIVADAFSGKTPLERHKMVYEALGDLMHSDIHALSLQAKAPGETR